MRLMCVWTRRSRQSYSLPKRSERLPCLLCASCRAHCTSIGIWTAACCADAANSMLVLSLDLGCRFYCRPYCTPWHYTCQNLFSMAFYMRIMSGSTSWRVRLWVRRSCPRSPKPGVQIAPSPPGPRVTTMDFWVRGNTLPASHQQDAEGEAHFIAHIADKCLTPCGDEHNEALHGLQGTPNPGLNL